MPLALFVCSVTLLLSLATTERFCAHKRRPPFFSALERKPLPYSQLLLLSAPFRLASTGMAAAAVYTTQVSAGESLHVRRQASPLPIPIRVTLPVANDAHLTKRPSVKLKIPGGSSNIFNSVVVTSESGQSLYSISSNSKCTTLVSCKHNVEVATVEWDHSSPRMVFRHKKVKCKEWLPLAGPDTECVPGLRYCLMSF